MGVGADAERVVAHLAQRGTTGATMLAAD